MSELSVEEALDIASESAKEYDWNKASESLRKAIHLSTTVDPKKLGEIYEEMSYSIYRAARQADSLGDFTRGVRQAISSYHRTTELLERSDDPGREGMILRCKAMLDHLLSWLIPDSSEKRRLLAQSWSYATQAMNLFKMARNQTEHWRTLSQLSLSSVLSFALEPTQQIRIKTAKAGLEHAEEAVRNLTASNPYEAARACITAFYHVDILQELVQPEEFERLRMGIDYWERALRLSEKAALIELASLGSPSLQTEGEQKALEVWEKAMQYVNATRDQLLMGQALNNIAHLTGQKGLSVDNPDSGRELWGKSLEYAAQSRFHYGKIGFQSCRAVSWVESPEADYYSVLARFFETDLERKRSLLEKGLTLCPAYLQLAKQSGYPEVVLFAHHVYGRTLGLLSMMQSTTEAKRSLLTQSLEHRVECTRLGDELGPFHYWNRGLYHCALGETKALLANLSSDLESKRKQLVEAVRESEEGAKLCQKHASLWEGTRQLSHFSSLGLIHYAVGGLLVLLSEATGKTATLKRAVGSYEDAGDCYAKLDIPARSAECHWAGARAYEKLSDYLKAAEEFDRSCDNYQTAAARIPNLKGFYLDYSIYMKAWSEIQKAKYHHEREEYGIAKSRYEKASALHESTRTWNYLAPNYLAWARLESAEASSRVEHCDFAIESFQEAGRLFHETQTALENRLNTLTYQDDMTLAHRLAVAARTRREYCLARIAMEKARVLDKSGEHLSAAEKYGEAVQELEELVPDLESEQDKREMKLIITLAKAWETMTRAEADTSHQLFLRASELFDEAKKLTQNEKSKMLALGHRHFCRALASGTRFAATMDLDHHVLAQQHLENAAICYLKAGFQKASEYARATRLLLDAYAYVNEANRERGSEDKLKFYSMAQKVLQASAECYSRAEQPARRIMAQGLLEKIRTEKELAFSLSEILPVPGIVSTTATFPAPRPTYEKALGVERFEDGVIQASVITARRDVKVGEEVQVKIELVNAGRSLAQLVKLEGVIPEGFELTEKPTACQVDGPHLDTRGKRLGPLKTETLSLVLKPKSQGRAYLRPRVLYFSESGRSMVSEAEPVEFTVTHGDRPLSEERDFSGVPSYSQLRSKQARTAFEYLMKEFTEDYLVRHLYVEKAGWRTLMDLVRKLDLPKRAFYGDHGGKGRVLNELERRGLVETRIFPEERGRGGDVRRIRVAYGNEVVKRLVDRSMME